MRTILLTLTIALLALLNSASNVTAGPLQAGVAKQDITDRDAGPVNDPLYAKALVLSNGDTTIVLITIDAVAIGEIGRIRNDFLPNVRSALEKELNIKPSHVFINASHCHGVVHVDVQQRTIQAVKDAARNMVQVKVGAGRGSENRIMENRRLLLKDGSEADVRHAYSLPPDEKVAAIGPIDPEIGLLRIDRATGEPFAVLYNFACHPIQGVPSKGNTADFPGFASKVIEENLGEGVMAFFVQGCAGDINPVQYKDVHNPRDAEPFGNQLGLSALRGIRKIKTGDNAQLKAHSETLSLPRAADYEQRIARLEAEQAKLLASLRGTSLNLKTFLPLYVQYKLADDSPSYSSHRYLLDKSLGREDLLKLDAENKANMEAYVQNILTMEQLTRNQVNLALLKRHQAQTLAAGSKTLEVEVGAIRIGDFTLVTFPGELTVPIGLHIKKQAPQPFTFVAGYTNGYIYYTPTAEQRSNTGHAQEDCDCLVAPQWQKLFEQRVESILKKL
ncbi:MAG: hypothetical protein WD768_18200 [Phycisphaeraceae bacterium]